MIIDGPSQMYRALSLITSDFNDQICAVWEGEGGV